MMLAITDEGQRVVAAKGLAAKCPVCGLRVAARCTSEDAKYTAHWAHARKINCDPWWENETEWHRAWKNRFPRRCQEVVHHDGISGEKHVADVKTDYGLVVEFQNSAMNSTELRSRESFYGNMVWIVNAKSFLKNFYLLDLLPDPESEFASDLMFHQRRYHHFGNTYWRLSENPDVFRVPNTLVEIHCTDDIKTEIESHYIGHHLFDWVRPRRVWFESKKDVYLDFGEDYCLLLQRYANNPYSPCWSVQFKLKAHLIAELLSTKCRLELPHQELAVA